MRVKILSIDRSSIASLAGFAGLLGVAMLSPLFHQQFVTGTMVNAVLFISTALLGWPSAVAIGAIPSLIAVSIGTLPQALIPMIPFIITSNTLLIVVFHLLKNKNAWLGAITGATVKFLFLYASSVTLFGFIFPQKIAASAGAMMSWPQFYTALTGGITAFLVLKIIRQRLHLVD
ncbi:MAG: iron hydrogenase [Candidatus Pacebacteria bacterium]|nr:iron hydrogenase [Candidatus Paceibacterota bacterium]